MSGLTKSFTVINFGNTLATTIMFFFQNVQNLMLNPEMEQRIENKFIVFHTIAFELGVANSHNLEQDTCHQGSMC